MIVGGFSSNGIAFLLTVIPAASSAFSASDPVIPFGPKVHEHQVIVRPAGDDPVSPRGQLGGERLRVLEDPPLVLSERRLERLLEADRLGRDHVDQRPALSPRKEHLVHALGHALLAENHAAAGAAERLVRRGGDEIRVWGMGEGCRPAEIGPAMWAMSAMALAPTDFAIRPNAAKSSVRE